MHLTLKDNSTIVIIGGGPAGSFFAHFALRQAKERGLKINITILDGSVCLQKTPAGCNRCVAVLSENLVNKMRYADIAPPKANVEQKIDGYYFQTKERGIVLHHPAPGRKPDIVTIFRGNSPCCQELTGDAGYDGFLLRHLESQGVTVISAAVEEIELPEHPQDLVNVVYVESGIRKKIAADLAVGAFGLDTELTKRIVGRKFGYRTPQSVRSCNASLYLGHAFIQEKFHNAVHVFAPEIKPIAFGVFIPNGNYATVSLIGKEDITKAHLLAFLNHPGARKLLPREWTPPEDLCICFPRIPVNHAEHPYTNRLVIIGDAGISGAFKNGIESAFDSARLAAGAAFDHGISSENFRKEYYNPALKLLAQAHFYGNLISRLHVALFPHVFAALVRQSYGLAKGRLATKRGQRLSAQRKPALGPLENGQTVAIVGGGQAGASCAIALKNIARTWKLTTTRSPFTVNQNTRGRTSWWEHLAWKREP